MADGGVPGSGVRPTRRCLGDLDVKVPDVGTVLDLLDHELVKRAQTVPDRVAGGGGERVVSLDDHVFWKVKTEAWRGAATELSGVIEAPTHNHGALGEWWLCAAGERQADSPHHDFYERLREECEREKRRRNQEGGRIRAAVCTAHLLPDDWDVKRLKAELAYHAYLALRATVRRAAFAALRSPGPVEFQLGDHTINLLVRDEDELYLIVSARSLADVRLFGLVLNAIPGLVEQDWQPDSPVLAHVDVSADDVVWAAPIGGETRAALEHEFGVGS